MKNILYKTLLLTLIIGIKQAQAQFYNQGSEVTIQSGATVTIEGDFFNKVGSNFKNSGNLEIKKEVVNNQYMTDDFGGYWIFNGTDTQKISGTEMIWINALNINNPFGFLLQNSLRISKQMEFNSGIMTAENLGNFVTFTKDAGIGSPAPSDDSHINGEVVKEGDNQTFTYPVGNGKKYQPIEVAFAKEGNENGLLAKYYDTDAGSVGFGTSGTEATPLNNYNSKEYWDLIPINNGFTKGTVKVFGDGYNDSFINPASLQRVAHLSSITGKWENEGTNTGSGTATSGSVISNEISTWSPFTLGTVAAVALPIRLVNFTGKKVGETNVLNWQTNQEINASHFEIERSSPLTPKGEISNEKFEKIGEVKAANKISEATNYEFSDQQTTNNKIIYYRLKMIDFDGKFAYSKIILIRDLTGFENLSGLLNIGNFYPNPAIENKANIDINNAEKAEWIISTVDISGKIIKSDKRILEKGLNTLQFENFQKGMNFIQFESNGKVIVRKLIR